MKRSVFEAARNGEFREDRFYGKEAITANTCAVDRCFHLDICQYTTQMSKISCVMETGMRHTRAMSGYTFRIEAVPVPN